MGLRCRFFALGPPTWALMQRHLRTLFSLLLLGCFGCLGTLTAVAQGSPADSPLGASAQQLPAYLAHAGLEQRLGHPLPLSTLYTDETGATAPLSTFIHDKPTAIALVYYRCVMLCPQVLHGLATGLRGTGLSAGKDYNVLVFSIDPKDTPADARIQKAQFLSDAGIPAAQASSVHFLTGDQGSINAIAGATGFHYVMVPGPDGKLDQFAHSSVVIFATPEGVISKYLAGVSYPDRDLRLALLGASKHRISNPVDLLILYCCSYNPVVGRYSVSIIRVLGLAGMGAIIAMVVMLILLTRTPRSHTAA